MGGGLSRWTEVHGRWGLQAGPPAPAEGWPLCLCPVWGCPPLGFSTGRPVFSPIWGHTFRFQVSFQVFSAEISQKVGIGAKQGQKGIQHPQSRGISCRQPLGPVGSRLWHRNRDPDEWSGPGGQDRDKDLDWPGYSVEGGGGGLGGLGLERPPPPSPLTVVLRGGRLVLQARVSGAALRRLRRGGLGHADPGQESGPHPLR